MAGRRITVQFLGEDKSLGRTADQVEGRTSKIGDRLKKVGAVVGVGLGIAGAAAIKFGGAAIKSASDAQQSMGATETVFGRYADTVVKTSNKAANAVGLSANEYRENANLIGSLFKNQGVAADELAGKTDKMIGLGADLAATFGGTTKEAVEALGSAFKGEYDPLERYGISLKDSTINAELAKRGQDKLTGAALTQAKQMAATDLIMRQSKDSLGAFGRESNTLAGQQQRLSAKFENLKATLGQKLLPVATKVVGWVSKFIDEMGKGQGAGGAFAKVVRGIGDVLRPVGNFIGKQVVPFVKDLANRFNDANKETGGWSKKMRDLEPFIRVVKAALKGLWEGIKWAASNGIPVLVKWWGILAKGLGAAGKQAIWLWNGAFAPALRFITKGMGTLMNTWAGVLRALGKVPGFGWARDAADKMQNAANRALGLSRAIKDIPPKKTSTVTTNFITNRVERQWQIDYGKKTREAGTQMLWRARARGGHVIGGQEYRVNERGQEFFRPSQSGRIVNAAATKRMAGRGASETFYVELDLQLDGKHIQTKLLKLKRREGGRPLGIA